MSVANTSLSACGHKTMLCFAQMKLRQAANDVMLRINDVALRANGLTILYNFQELHFCTMSSIGAHPQSALLFLLFFAPLLAPPAGERGSVAAGDAAVPSCHIVVARRGVALSFNSLCRGLRYAKRPHCGLFRLLTEQSEEVVGDHSSAPALVLPLPPTACYASCRRFPLRGPLQA